MLLAVVMLIDVCTGGGNMPVRVTIGSVEDITSISGVGTGVVGELAFWPHTQKSFRV